MNVLFVHEVDWLKKVVFEIHELAESLSKLGHNVYAIDFEDSWRRKGNLDFGSLKTIEFRGVHRVYDDAAVTLRRPGFIKLPILDRVSAAFTHYYEIDRVVREKKIDVIVLYSAPTNGLQTIKIAKNHKIPVIFRSVDILHMLVPIKVLRPLTFYIEKLVYRNVDKILAITPTLAEYVIDNGADLEIVDLLLIGVNIDNFRQDLDVSALKEQLGITERDRVIIFIGTFFEFSGLDRYIDQFPAILQAVPEAKLLLVGGGHIFEKIKNQVDKLGLNDKIILTDFQPYNLMPLYINLASICINPFLINNTTRDIIPGKIYQYIACGKPVIATPLDGLKSLIPDENSGVVYSDIKDFGQNTIILLKNSGYAKCIGNNGYHYCLKNNDQLVVTHKLETFLLGIVRDLATSMQDT